MYNANSIIVCKIFMWYKKKEVKTKLTIDAYENSYKKNFPRMKCTLSQ